MNIMWISIFCAICCFHSSVGNHSTFIYSNWFFPIALFIFVIFQKYTFLFFREIFTVQECIFFVFSLYTCFNNHELIIIASTCGSHEVCQIICHFTSSVIRNKCAAFNKCRIHFRFVSCVSNPPPPFQTTFLFD